MSQTVQFYGKLFSSTRSGDTILGALKEVGTVQVWETPSSMFLRYTVAALILGGIALSAGALIPWILGDIGNFIAVPLVLISGLVFLYGVRVAFVAPAMMLISREGLHVPVRGVFVPWRAVRGWSGQTANLGFTKIPIINVSVMTRQVERRGRFTWLFSFYSGAWVLPFVLAPFVRGTAPDRPLHSHILRIFGGEGADCLETIFDEETIDKLRLEVSEQTS